MISATRNQTTCHYCQEQCFTLIGLGEHLYKVHSQGGFEKEVPDEEIPVKKTLRPHQLEAVNALERAFLKAKRATLVMACGTGKTLVGLELSRRLNARHVIVLSPSLGLIRQHVQEWKAQGNNTEFLCVCSDKTVVHEDSPLPQHVGCPVTTESSHVRQFLKAHKTDPCVVFSTYQSSPLLKSCATFAFDLCIYDEAHRTAGDLSSPFAALLKDRDVHIKKRLFMTATPKYYERRAADGALAQTSMDDLAVYGKVAHALSFNEAVQRGIICDFKVLISLCVSNEELLGGNSLIAQIASVAKVIREYPINKILAFHSSIKGARQFASSPLLRKGLPGFKLFQVNAHTPVRARSRALQSFASSKTALLSNVRCLAEGIDVPSIDMVVFISPKRSQVDVTQAIGRAVRKSPGKTMGYVLVPLLCEQSNLSEEWEIASGFAEMVTLIASLKGADDDLRSALRNTSSRHIGKIKNANKMIAQIVDIKGPPGLADLFKGHLAIKVLGGPAARWEFYYSKLEAFKKKHGHADVPFKWKEDLGLSRWVNTQRRNRKVSTLSASDAARLDLLGFVWSIQDAQWEAQYKELEEYKKRFGCLYVVDNDADFRPLYHWVQTQRRLNRKGLLDKWKKEALEVLGFAWDPRDAKWGAMYLRLKRFAEQRGNIKHILGIGDLGEWLVEQQALIQKGSLSQEKKELLNALDTMASTKAR